MEEWTLRVPGGAEPTPRGVGVTRGDAPPAFSVQSREPRGHSPDQQLQEDHVTAAACEHQAHREERAHGQRGEGERARGGSARLDHYLGGGTEHRPFPERCSSPAPPPTLRARGAVVHCQPRPHSFEGALWS